jgi:DNA repair protein RecO (recombination protein O)
MNGRLLCGACLRKRSGGRAPEELGEYSARNILLPLDPSALASLRYVLSAPLSRIFAFQISDPDSMAAFCRAAEVYLINHLERSFDTLDFYRSVKN